jgi:hypothetical protein
MSTSLTSPFLGVENYHENALSRKELKTKERYKERKNGTLNFTKN